MFPNIFRPPSHPTQIYPLFPICTPMGIIYPVRIWKFRFLRLYKILISAHLRLRIPHRTFAYVLDLTQGMMLQVCLEPRFLIFLPDEIFRVGLLYSYPALLVFCTGRVFQPPPPSFTYCRFSCLSPLTWMAFYFSRTRVPLTMCFGQETLKNAFFNRTCHLSLSPQFPL